MRALLTASSSMVSEISKLEVLGYQKLTSLEKSFFESVFELLPVISISSTIIDKAIVLRQAEKMSVGDAIIAATAIIHSCELFTRNVQDFSNIAGLVVQNPVS